MLPLVLYASADTSTIAGQVLQQFRVIAFFRLVRLYYLLTLIHGSVLVSTEGARTHYRIPKHLVEGFDGHSVSLKIQKQELGRFKSDQGEGFGKVK
jgi:hypothetical protein